MPIITISRGSFSGGKSLAEALSRRLGYRCIDRDQVIQKAAAWGVSEHDLKTAIEKPPSFLGQSQHTKYMYLTFIQAALAQEAQKGDLIYHGLAGHLLLGKGPHVLRTRIIASMEYRIATVEKRLKHTRKQAIAYIEKMDEERRKWTQFLYGVDWTDASLYDLVVNLEQMSPQEACDVIVAAAELNCFASSAATKRAIDDLAMASLVKVNLAMNPETSDQFEVEAHGGAVSIKGKIDAPAQAKKIRSFVQTIPGVQQVHLHELKLATRI